MIQGKVTVNGAVVTDPASKVAAGDVVVAVGRPVCAPHTSGVVFYKPIDRAVALVHPPELHVVMPLKKGERGVELLLADPELARRVADPRHKQREQRDGRLRVAYAGFTLDELDPGDWRPLSPKDIERLRRSVHLPPR